MREDTLVSVIIPTRNERESIADCVEKARKALEEAGLAGEVAAERRDSGKPLVVACIPAYNEERTIASVILKTQKYADKVLVCDDGSTDLTGEIARRMGAEVLVHERNRGKGEAVKTLLRRALELEADVIVTLDADGQHNPDDIPKLLAPILRGEADLVVGSRFTTGSSAEMPRYRLLGTRVINWLVKRHVRVEVKDIQSGFRALTRRAAEVALKAEAKGYGIEQEQLTLAAQAGLRIVEAPIEVRYKGLKSSKKTPLLHGTELLAHLIRMIVEQRPLLMLGVPGALILLAGIASTAVLIYHFNTSRYFSIPLAIISLGAFTSGLLLVTTALTLYALTRLAERVKG
ncbi:MAG: glycosyltransferase family 2 protein [Thermofilum sp.]|nr:glycosyltransferase family 2 protein [Thermoproteota archaeon]